MEPLCPRCGGTDWEFKGFEHVEPYSSRLHKEAICPCGHTWCQTTYKPNTVRVRLDYMDGRYLWQLSPEGWDETSFEIPAAAYSLWKAAKEMNDIVQQQLLWYDNILGEQRRKQCQQCVI